METREIKITRETAERWYNGCDKELKELALQTYPELKPKYEVGKWYKSRYAMFKCTRINEKGMPLGYGWVYSCKWLEDDEMPWASYTKQFQEATHEEVEQRFKEEAKKRGYYDKPFVAVYNGVRSKDAHNIYADGYFAITGRFWLQNGCVFDNGKWAEFVKEPEYKIGEKYAFADRLEDFDKGNFKIEKLTCIDETALLPYRGKSLFYKHIRKIEYKFVD